MPENTESLINILKSELTSVDEYSPAVDTEYRNLLEKLLYRFDLDIESGQEVTITRITPTQVVYQNENGIHRFLDHQDQLGQGGQDLYERVGTQNSFDSEYDPSQSTIGTGVYAYTGQYNTIRFLKSGALGKGHYDIAALIKKVQGESSSFKETEFSDGVLTKVTEYKSNGGRLLNTKTFSYTDNLLTQIVKKDAYENTILTTTITYDSNGNIESINNEK